MTLQLEHEGRKAKPIRVVIKALAYSQQEGQLLLLLLVCTVYSAARKVFTYMLTAEHPEMAQVASSSAPHRRLRRTSVPTIVSLSIISTAQQQ